MAYNYFACRHPSHPVPVKLSIAQPAGLANTYASPMCPNCGRTMQRYDTGSAPTDPRPVPPPPPEPLGAPKVSKLDRELYQGIGTNPGHGQATWVMTVNDAEDAITIRVMSGVNRGGAYDSTKVFRVSSGLLDPNQPGDQADWWLKSPYPRTAAAEVWMQLKLGALLGGGLGTHPAVIDVGVKLGNAVFGLIHFLHGHAPALNTDGLKNAISGSDAPDAKELSYRTLLQLSVALDRFTHDNLKRVNHDPVGAKYMLQSQNHGVLVIANPNGGPRWGVTTLYNTNNGMTGAKLWEG